MQTQSPGRHAPASGRASPQRSQVKRVIVGSWAVGSALVFLVFLLIGVEDRAALPLVAILATALSAEIVAGAVCLLKGYDVVGWLAMSAWLAFPIGSTISSAVYPDSLEPAFLGSAIGTGVILVVAGLAAMTALRPARWNSRWERAGWSTRR